MSNAIGTPIRGWMRRHDRAAIAEALGWRHAVGIGGSGFQRMEVGGSQNSFDPLFNGLHSFPNAV